jgi:type IV pilus assembly protein PilM
VTVKANKVLGLDFLPGQIRVVALSGTQRRFSVVQMSAIHLPTPDDDPTHFEPQEVAISLRDFIQSTGLKHYQAAIGFQERKSILRLLTMPVMPDDELATTIRFEFDQVLDESIEEYILDFTVLGEVEVDGATKNSILVAIVPKISLFPFIEAVEAARLPLVRIDLPVIANLSALHHTDDKLLARNTVIVHLEQVGGDVIIFDKGNLAFIRRISLGLSELKYTFKGVLETREEIETIGGYKQDEYRLPSEHFALGKPLVDQILSEVERTLSFYKSQKQMLDYNYEDLVLCGTGVWPRNLSEVMENTAQFRVSLADPLSRLREAFTFTPEAEESMTMPQFSAALGLALESLA